MLIYKLVMRWSIVPWSSLVVLFCLWNVDCCFRNPKMEQAVATFLTLDSKRGPICLRYMETCLIEAGASRRTISFRQSRVEIATWQAPIKRPLKTFRAAML